MFLVLCGNSNLDVLINFVLIKKNVRGGDGITFVPYALTDGHTKFLLRGDGITFVTYALTDGHTKFLLRGGRNYICDIRTN